MKPREYCCCAIPLVNAGIYSTLVVQSATGILVGVLAVGTPSIVGASTPSFASWLLGIICFVAAAVQFLGFIGVSREKPVLYRRYVTLHGLVVSAAFSIAVAWIIMSATRHSTAQDKCIQDFLSDTTGSGSATTLCNIFPWVDVGIMGALWVILAILHLYLYVVLSSYGTSQRRDHEKFNQNYDSIQPLTTENIPLANRADPWDTRLSGESINGTDEGNGRKYKHVRQQSSVSASDVLSEPYQQPKDTMSNPDYGYQTPYPHYTDDQNQLPYPSYVYTQDPTPTPINAYNNYDAPTSSSLNKPSQAQAHPGES
ncbi:uncharacterized protein LACBIDRAFT_300731 [Laccaria bicolor S238N-H82]|uniref:Predicted protein n=1 Tax=Laccaria bicolor (strain S238N-H82 / ATCC MYA-4686) TaxID=486041 RepID=B0CQ71_LACBS|nr:uncharacterized protein LACBIDRAFT_300731 [Laccaria bicolor S238N-H82]EDR15022.1 predicted protein [Laccaria bicolor S238N-H82]|eukprot:XP_001873230.1 predicted protein [Laccaria bicolor S238N-H82]